ncbi:MAG: hypothetical protein ABR971_09900 [Acidobacteriaceae bacterium]|jgi:hypothetical protein
MKISTAVSLLLVLSPIALRAQTDATTPQTKAPAAMEAMKPPVPPSKSVNLSFEGKTVTLSLTDLVNMPNQVTVQVHNAHRGGAEETYSGPLLSDVLAKIGVTPTRENQPLILHSTIVATGTDHYYVLYSGGEVMFSSGKVIVAVMKSGLPDTEGGLIQLINTSDVKPARWVHGLMGIAVMTLAAQN